LLVTTSSSLTLEAFLQSDLGDSPIRFLSSLSLLCSLLRYFFLSSLSFGFLLQVLFFFTVSFSIFANLSLS